MKESGTSTPHLWLARFAKLVVLVTFVLIAIGGHTTTAGAGMAFADWPLSAGSFNPDGWWNDFFQRLEHGHRLTAETVGLLVGISCAWIWRAQWAIPSAVVVSLGLALAAKVAGAQRETIAHIGLWSSALTFAGLILFSAKRRDHVHPAPLRWLSFGAFLGVCAQAVLGGFRVTIESGGNPGLAIAFRVVHGCFAQLELCMLVAIAAMLSPVWSQIRLSSASHKLARLGWITVGLIFLQLIAGASMRHLGAGLAISTFPQASADGGWMPTVHNLPTDLNFTHTRFGAMIVTILVVVFALRALRSARGEIRIVRPAFLLLGLLLVQLMLGMIVIWKLRPPILTTIHVVNGAALLATAVLLTVRLAFGTVESEFGGDEGRASSLREVRG